MAGSVAHRNWPRGRVVRGGRALLERFAGEEAGLSEQGVFGDRRALPCDGERLVEVHVRRGQEPFPGAGLEQGLVQVRRVATQAADLRVRDRDDYVDIAGIGRFSLIRF